MGLLLYSGQVGVGTWKTPLAHGLLHGMERGRASRPAGQCLCQLCTGQWRHRVCSRRLLRRGSCLVPQPISSTSGLIGRRAQAGIRKLWGQQGPRCERYGWGLASTWFISPEGWPRGDVAALPVLYPGTTATKSYPHSSLCIACLRSAGVPGRDGRAGILGAPPPTQCPVPASVGWPGEP